MNAPDRTASRGQDKKTEMQIALRSVLCGPHSLAFGDSESSHYFFTAGHRCCSQLTGLMKTLREKLEKKCALAVSVVVVSAWCASCGKSTSTTSPTTPAPDTLTETFAGTLPVGGSAFYSFSIATAGTVTATLATISGDQVPSSVVVNLGIGTLSQFTCAATPTAVQISGTAGVPTQVSASEQPGVYCVIISDIGNLFTPASFTVTIDHPLKAAS